MRVRALKEGSTHFPHGLNDSLYRTYQPPGSDCRLSVSSRGLNVVLVFDEGLYHLAQQVIDFPVLVSDRSRTALVGQCNRSFALID
ncbi:MAG: hypothetical protein ACE5HM_01365 [Acidiferrobacterales bacterium]